MSLLGFVSSLILLLPSVGFCTSYGPPLPSVAADVLVSQHFLKLAVGAYFTGIVISILGGVVRKEGSGIVRYVIFIAIFLHAAGLLLRWKETYDYNWGHIPLTLMYEAVNVVCLFVAIIGISLLLRRKTESILLPFIFLVILCMTINLLHAHGISAIFDASYKRDEQYVANVKLNYMLFAIRNLIFSGACSLLTSSGIVAMILFISKTLPNTLSQITLTRQPSEISLFQSNRLFVISGTALLYVGFVFNLFWSNFAWGTFWSWSPDEVLLAVALLSYTFVTVKNIIAGWNSGKATNRSLFGIIIVSVFYILIRWMF